MATKWITIYEPPTPPTMFRQNTMGFYLFEKNKSGANETQRETSKKMKRLKPGEKQTKQNKKKMNIEIKRGLF